MSEVIKICVEKIVLIVSKKKKKIVLIEYV